MNQQADIKFLFKDKYGLTEIPKNPNESQQEDIDLLNSGYPLAYIIGYVDFLNCKIDLSLKPLIPRPETEYWVEKVIQEYPHRNEPLKVLDIFCGSGCIGLALKKNLPNADVTFVDMSEDAIRQTKLNLKLNELTGEVIQSDMFKEVKTRFDLILANPPYVDENGLNEKSLRHEPDIALYAKENGLLIISAFLKEAPNFLNPNGVIYMEFGANQEEEISTVGLNVEFKKDQYSRVRYLRATQSGFQNA